jgi:predicted TIM-barrel fold metal-dependent hydrolase
MPLSIHVGSSSDLRATSPDAPLISSITLLSLSPPETAIDWMWSGNFSRFPDLKIVLSESGIAWVPSIVERLKRDVDRQRWARRPELTRFEGNFLTGDVKPRGNRTAFGSIPEDFDPFEVFRHHVFLSLIADDIGWNVLDYLGFDNVMMETDYPHSDSSYPHSLKMGLANLRDRTSEERDKVMRENAIRVYDFVPWKPN